MTFSINPNLIESNDVSISENADGDLEITHVPTGETMTLGSAGFSTRAVDTDEATTGELNGIPHVEFESGDDLAANINQAIADYGRTFVRLILPDGNYTLSESIDLTQTTNVEIDARGTKLKGTGGVPTVDATGAVGLVWYGGEIGGAGSDLPSENLLLAVSSNTLSQKNHFYSVDFKEASNANVSIIGAEENVFSGCWFGNSQGRWVTNSENPKHGETSPHDTIDSNGWTATLNRFVDGCAFSSSGNTIANGIELYSTSDQFTVTESFFADPGVPLFTFDLNDGNITQPVITTNRCDGTPPSVAEFANSSGSEKQIEGWVFEDNRWVVSNTIFSTPSDVKLSQPYIRGNRDINGVGFTFDGVVANGEVGVRGSSATFNNTHSGVITANAMGDLTLSGFTAAMIAAGNELHAIQGGNETKVTPAGTALPVQNLSGKTGNYVGETRLDDGTNVTAYLPCTWTGSAWQPSDGGATFT